MSEPGTVSLTLAFFAGLLSFLSPCVLPLVPSYVTFITGITLEELTTGSKQSARKHAAMHAGFFVLGFSIVFIALGATATGMGMALRRSLPLIQQVGGVVIIVFGLFLVGVLRLPWLMRERRFFVRSKPAGFAGSALVGVAFGAGWTPCVGPVLASILLYAGIKTSMAQGMLLLTAYAVGLGIPFFLAAIGFNWYLAGARWMLRWLRPIEIAAGLVLIVMGALLVTGRFTMLTGFLAGFGQMINIGL